MILDAHQHFWQYRACEYPWIDDSMNTLKRDFLPNDLKPELLRFDIGGTIAVQARQNLEETHWLLDLAKKNDFIKGVVGWVDLCSSDVKTQLEKISGQSKLVGVRHVVHDEPDDQFMARSDFQKGISLLSEYNLTYDLLVFPKHLPLATQLVINFPQQIFVLDHIAKPHIKQGIHSPWDKDIRKLAESPNVFCKLSGMVTEADWNNWQSKDFSYYLDCVFECFGPERLMFGSDWPVCTLAAKYKQVISILFDYLAQHDPEVQAKILGENCAGVYGISES
jgi:L-fuconolactonase